MIIYDGVKYKKTCEFVQKHLDLNLRNEFTRTQVRNFLAIHGISSIKSKCLHKEYETVNDLIEVTTQMIVNKQLAEIFKKVMTTDLTITRLGMTYPRGVSLLLSDGTHIEYDMRDVLLEGYYNERMKLETVTVYNAGLKVGNMC